MLQGKFDYVKLVLHGESREGYLVDVSDGVGTLVEMNCNTAFQLSSVLASIEVLDRGEKSFLPRLMTKPQLRARLFTLSAKQGVKFALNYVDYLERESTIPLWVYCCGSEMLLRNQLPQRAQSLNQQSVRLEITFEYPGEYIGHKCCMLATKEEEASIFDRSQWQPVSLLEQRFHQLFTRRVHVLVVHHT